MAFSAYKTIGNVMKEFQISSESQSRMFAFTGNLEIKSCQNAGNIGVYRHLSEFEPDRGSIVSCQSWVHYNHKNRRELCKLLPVGLNKGLNKGLNGGKNT